LLTIGIRAVFRIHGKQRVSLGKTAGGRREDAVSSAQEIAISTTASTSWPTFWCGA
jgi:hypothetical protein